MRTNSFFAQHAKVALGELLLMIYFWSMDQSRKQTSRMMNANNNLVCQVFRSLEDVCSTDIARNPFIPFGGRSIVKCDESKFNHKAKVSSILRSHLQYRVFFSNNLNYKRRYFLLILKSDRGEKKGLTWAIQRLLALARPFPRSRITCHALRC